jgi:hypothetical protein
MKKTLISNNYSLLVLILLILFITYSNLPDNINNNMTGGAFDLNNPYFTMEEDKLIENLASHSMIYSYLKDYIYVYGGVILLLVSVAGYFASKQYEIQGLPIAGIPGGITWDGEGMQFFNYFYIMAKQAYGIYPGAPPTSTAAIKQFETEFDNFILEDNGNARESMDLFCNTIAPCNMCNCSGPDPNYSGPFENTPMVRFKGKDTNYGNCVPKNDTGAPSPFDAAASVVKMQEKRGIEDLAFGRIPNCCCHLWKSALGPASNFTAPRLQAFVNALPQALNISATTGCEPSTPLNPPTLTQKNEDKSVTTIIPHTTNNENQYVYNMVLACSKKNGLTDLDKTKFTFKKINNVVNNLSPDFLACKDYDVDLDEGISAAHVTKNASKYITPSIAHFSSADKPEKPGDVTKDWTSGIWTQTTGKPPKIEVTKPSDWPTVAPFNLKGNINNYWYKSPSSNINYQLTVNPRLFEVGAYPVKVIDATIYDTKLTDASAIAFLEKYLSKTALEANGKLELSKRIHLFGGLYYFP